MLLLNIAYCLYVKVWVLFKDYGCKLLTEPCVSYEECALYCPDHSALTTLITTVVTTVVFLHAACHYVMVSHVDGRVTECSAVCTSVGISKYSYSFLSLSCNEQFNWDTRSLASFQIIATYILFNKG